MVFITRGLILIDLGRGRRWDRLNEKHSVVTRLTFPVAGLSSMLFTLAFRDIKIVLFFYIMRDGRGKTDFVKGVTKPIKPHTNVTV